MSSPPGYELASVEIFEHGQTDDVLAGCTLILRPEVPMRLVPDSESWTAFCGTLCEYTGVCKSIAICPHSMRFIVSGLWIRDEQTSQ